MRFSLLLALILCSASALAQPGATFRAVSLSGGAEAYFVGTAWSYSAGSASTVNRFAALDPAAPHNDAMHATGVVGDVVLLSRPVLPGAQPASVRSASHLVFDAQGEGLVLVALEVGEQAEPYIYPLTLHPGAEKFRVPLEHFRQRSTRAAFQSDSVVRVSFRVVARPGETKPFALTVGSLAFEHKRPLGSRY